MTGHRVERGMTLIELIITIVLIALLTTGLIAGSGALTGSRLRGATSMIAGGIRLAFTRASATSRTMRLVLDIDQSRVWLEESADAVRVAKNDTAGGASAMTPEEKLAHEAADRIVKGPHAPRPSFQPVKALGFDAEGKVGRDIGSGVRIVRVETSRMLEPQTTGRAYLYFWPGGRTEPAAIYLSKASSTDAREGLTLMVSPLTGRVQTLGGSQHLERPRDDVNYSEREDHAF